MSRTNSNDVRFEDGCSTDEETELFGININNLNIEDISDSSDASTREENDNKIFEATAGGTSNENNFNVQKPITRTNEINHNAGDWKMNGIKCRSKPLELFLESIGLSFFLQSLLDANILTTQNFLDLGMENTTNLLETIGATDNDVHKIITVLFLNDTNISNQSDESENHVIEQEKIETKQRELLINYDKAECLYFLKERIPASLGLNYSEIEKNNVNGEDLYNALSSTREMIDIFGLDTCAKRVKFERIIRNNNGNVSMPNSSSGTLYSSWYLKTVAPLYDLHMGCENMAPLLYSLVRFLKVQNILEVGAGYTSIFLLQALYDNQQEIGNYAKLIKSGQCKVGNQPYCVDGKLNKIHEKKSILHCVDHMGHEHTTADHVLQIAKDLGIDSHLQLHNIDFWDFELQDDQNDEDQKIELIWLDFAAGKKLSKVLNRWWHRLKNGGYILCHSTLTNSMTREWLEQMRSRENNKWVYETISFLEPHKYFQNSFSMFQKRENNYKEDILTRYP
jgi:predicted O-methyltransferase YrrM